MQHYYKKCCIFVSCEFIFLPSFSIFFPFLKLYSFIQFTKILPLVLIFEYICTKINVDLCRIRAFVWTMTQTRGFCCFFARNWEEMEVVMHFVKGFHNAVRTE